ncbi:excinuclease ABC subunit UvrC [Candidatus Peregrinibacteria bacterium]|nr:excinuclease ABC subunit UvrC [Candidatus Peregrinibacteria bacterium]
MVSTEEDRLSNLRKRVARAPQDPGVYKWLDDNGRVLYVGKAKNLRKRLSSYVRSAPPLGPWKESFMRQIVDFDVLVATSEFEALILETNLIKQLRPKYNVLMKDDKNHIFIRVSVQDSYPSVATVRRFEQDGARYFGPYMNGDEVNQTLDLLHEAVGYRACAQSIAAMNRGGRAVRPCLEFQIGRCNGLCAGKITKDEYRNRIDQMVSFLKGQKDSIKSILLERMRAAADDRKFELAAKLRNYIGLIEGGADDKQVAADGTGENSDILGVAISSNRAHVTILHRRNGRLVGESHFALSGHPESAASVLEQFIPQYYDDGREIPEAIIISEAPPDDGKVIEILLRERRKKAARLIVPERGKKSRLLQLAERNAREQARQMELKWETEERNTTGALAELAEALALPAPPQRIEGYDISHLGGTETVGSMVVIKDGRASNDQYRSFIIRTMQSGEVDDCKAMKEVLTRRLRRLTENVRGEENKWNTEGITFGKALKKDQAEIERIHAANTDDMENSNVRCGNCIVARHDGSIVGFGRIYKHPKSIMELESVWVDEPFRGGKLGQLIARKLLRMIKKGKVYSKVQPELEQYYADIGFRYIITTPKELLRPSAKRKCRTARVVMMWESSRNKTDASLSSKPDLIVVDGGKGQLNAADGVVKSFGLDIPVVALAKREEEIFAQGRSSKIACPDESPAKFLLMRLRDEAHRFANAHRVKRTINAIKSPHGKAK